MGATEICGDLSVAAIWTVCLVRPGKRAQQRCAWRAMLTQPGADGQARDMAQGGGGAINL
jgi:hypothetical protein